MNYKVNIIATLPHPTSDELYSQLFEVEDTEHPYRVRAIMKSTGEVGPQIRMYKKLSAAAKFFESHGVTW